VAIVDAYDNPNVEADLAVYRAQFGLPPCTTANGCFEKVAQDGASNLPHTRDQGWSVEESIDVDMVSAVCPNCHILLVEANSGKQTDLGQAVNTAAALGATEISNSYGGVESQKDLTYDNAYFNHPGIAITAGSGDSGYGGFFGYPRVIAVCHGCRRHLASAGHEHRPWLERDGLDRFNQHVQRL
jgi:subtilase family serine protease